MEKTRWLGLIFFAVVAFVAAAGVVTWAMGSGDEDAPVAAQNQDGLASTTVAKLREGSGGPGVSFGISGIIEYVVRDADGNIKEQGIIHNTTNDPEGLDEVLALTIGTAVTGTSAKFDDIGALCVNVSTDNPADGTLDSSLCDNLDGGGDGAGSNKNNPQSGTVAEVSESGNGTIIVTFVADGGSVTVMQIILTKRGTFQNSGAAGVAIADSDILAYQDVPDVSLADGDSVQYTWTLDFD